MMPSRVVPVLFVVLVVSSGSFVVDVSGTQRPAPVEFDETVQTGLTGVVTAQARGAGVEIPKAQVFYSQYRYVVGFHGVTSLVDELSRPGNAEQFGRPLSIYVTDYAPAVVELTDDGLIRLPNQPAGYERWVAVEDAWFVVGSRARTPAGPAVLGFSERASATAFVERYGGEVHEWTSVRAMAFGTERATRAAMRTARADRDGWADRAVTRAKGLLDRPVSVVVGSDAPNVSVAVERAPTNTTVLVPAGTYDVNVTVEKPVTIRGVGPETHLRGDGTGSVLVVTAPGVAVADLRISGVGNQTTKASVPGNESDWDYRVKRGYAYGDAGVEFDRANGSLVANVTIDTPANGLFVRWSDGTVIDGVTVNGTAAWQDGFMGVMDMESQIVVQHSTFRGGRDGVYTHHGDGIVVRDNHMTGMRFGVHEMYTSDALVANNTMRETNVGAIVMTRPTGNILVDNDVRRSRAGIVASGSASYVAGNVLVDNAVGLDVSARRSLYERNVVVENDVGLRGSTLIPTNRVVANDVVDNDRAAVAVLGPLRVWSGNHWSGTPGWDRDGDGTIDRTFEPTGLVDGRVDRVPGARTLAASPGMVALRAFQATVPGLRGTGVIDPEPRTALTRPDVVANETEGSA